MDPANLPSAEETRLARSILDYLIRHPEAKDTREGISTWWLQGQGIEHSAHELSNVLELLVACGFVVESRGPDSRPYYKINQQRFRDIAHFLQQADR